MIFFFTTGTVTDGEFCSLRSQGETRPLHLWQIIHDAKESRRRQNGEIGYAEHPRAGGTDDLETFFSIAHRYLGMLFSLKQFKEKWQKLVRYVNT